ncbi:hypothetical protein BC830DRAFT_1166128 [Chytriomyces sp. MP71]|nr:hypothetical protein BC830DRAFT_1166128 [Chytriomyces sp. MP71]
MKVLTILVIAATGALAASNACQLAAKGGRKVTSKQKSAALQFCNGKGLKSGASKGSCDLKSGKCKTTQCKKDFSLASGACVANPVTKTVVKTQTATQTVIPTIDPKSYFLSTFQVKAFHVGTVTCKTYTSCERSCPAGQAVSEVAWAAFQAVVAATNDHASALDALTILVESQDGQNSNLCNPATSGKSIGKGCHDDSECKTTDFNNNGKVICESQAAGQGVIAGVLSKVCTLVCPTGILAERLGTAITPQTPPTDPQAGTLIFNYNTVALPAGSVQDGSTLCLPDELSVGAFCYISEQCGPISNAQVICGGYGDFVSDGSNEYNDASAVSDQRPGSCGIICQNGFVAFDPSVDQNTPLTSQTYTQAQGHNKCVACNTFKDCPIDANKNGYYNCNSNQCDTNSIHICPQGQVKKGNTCIPGIAIGDPCAGDTPCANPLQDYAYSKCFIGTVTLPGYLLHQSPDFVLSNQCVLGCTNGKLPKTLQPLSDYVTRDYPFSKHGDDTCVECLNHFDCEVNDNGIYSYACSDDSVFANSAFVISPLIANPGSFLCSKSAVYQCLPGHYEANANGSPTGYLGGTEFRAALTKNRVVRRDLTEFSGGNSPTVAVQCKPADKKIGEKCYSDGECIFTAPATKDGNVFCHQQNDNTPGQCTLFCKTGNVKVDNGVNSVCK